MDFSNIILGKCNLLPDVDIVIDILQRCGHVSHGVGEGINALSDVREERLDLCKILLGSLEIISGGLQRLNGLDNVVYAEAVKYKLDARRCQGRSRRDLGAQRHSGSDRTKNAERDEQGAGCEGDCDDVGNLPDDLITKGLVRLINLGIETCNLAAYVVDIL